jgi:hypothetical protein
MSEWDEMWRRPFDDGAHYATKHLIEGQAMPAELQKDRASKEIEITHAQKTAAKIHALDKAEEIARRVKDASALEKALLDKMEFQRDFAGEYKLNFPEAGRPPKNYDSTDVILTADEWCKAHGFGIRVVQRWCELLEPEKFVTKKNAILKRCWELAELWQAANFSSDSIEWYTPARYLEAVREVLGAIDLDPASNAVANETVRAEEIFTKEDNGLRKQWHGRVFMNPPYGKADEGGSLAAAFCNKAISEYEAGNIDAGIILVNSLHSQAWQAPLYQYVVCFVDHRIQFISGDGEQNKNPTFQNIFIYLGAESEQFARTFSRLGYVMRSINA